MEAQIDSRPQKIIIERPQLSLDVGGPAPTFRLTKPNVVINPPTDGGIDVNMICQVLGGAGTSGEIPMMTQEEFDALPTKNPRSFYFITNEYGTLIKIYAGNRLICYSDASGVFTYNFPFVLA